MPHYLDTLKQLGFKDLTPQQKGKGRVSSLSSISRQLFKTHYDGYHPRTSRYLATALKRYINTRPKHERKTPEFVGEIRRKLLCLHEYNIQIAKMKFKYPRSEQLDALLVLYVELECGLLYGSYKEVDERHENEVQHSVLRLLKIILHDALHNSEVPLKSTIRACNKALLKLFATVRADCVTENRLVANVIMELLEKLGLLDEVNRLKGKNIPFYQDTCLRDPLVSTIRQNLATSDYESDIDSDEEPDIPMVTDDIFYSNSSNQKSFQPRSLFVNEVDRQMYITNSDVIKVSQRLKNYEPQSFFGKKENVFSDWCSASSEQMISNNFSQQYNSFNAQSKFNFKNSTHELGSCSSDVNFKQKGTFQHDSISSEEKAVKSSSLENQAQKTSNHFPNDSSSNDFFLKQNLHNITQVEANVSKNLPQSEILREDERAIEQNPTQSIFNNTDSNRMKAIHKVLIEDNSGVVEVHRPTTTDSNHGKDEMVLPVPNIGTTLDKLIDNGNLVSNSDIQTVEDAVSEISDISKSQEKPSKSTDVNNFECIIVEETQNDCSKNSVHSIHNRVIEVAESTPLIVDVQTETVELLEPTTTESPPAEDTIDLDAIPDIDGFRSNKTSVSESISNGLVTIEILSDEDDEEADYTFISSKENGQTQQLNTTPTNLLQLKDIKLEENEENRSPSFSIENSDSESQNFVNTNNSGSRNSDSAGFNGLRSNSTNGSVKEAEIVISDSEDDVVDVSEDEDVVVNDSLNVPTVDLDPVVETEISGTLEKSHGDNYLEIVQNENVDETTQNGESIDEPCVEEIPEINSESLIIAKDQEHKDFREETNAPKEISDDRNILATELNDNPEICTLETTEECNGKHAEVSLIEEDKQPSDLGEEDLNYVVNKNELQNETDDIQIATDALVQESEEISDTPEDTSYESTKLSSTSDCINEQSIGSTIAQLEDAVKESEYTEVEAAYVSMDSGVSKNTELVTECHEDEETISEPELDSYTSQINQTSESEHRLEIPAIPPNDFINEKRVNELLEQSTEAENEQESNVVGTTEAPEPSNILDEKKYEEEHAADIDKTHNVVSEHTMDSESELQVEESALVEEINTVPLNVGVSKEPPVTDNDSLVHTLEPVIGPDNSGSCRSMPEENDANEVPEKAGTVSNLVSKESSTTENDSLMDIPEPVVAPDTLGSCQSISEENIAAEELKETGTVPSNAEVSKEPSVIIENDSLVDTPESVVEPDNSGSCQSIPEGNVANEVIDCTTTIASAGEVYANIYQEPPVPPTYDSSVNLSTYNQPLSSERATEVLKDIVSQEVLPQKLENTTTNESFFYKSSLTSTLNEVEYVEYSPEKKVNGDLELLANIAADQETLAVKTDSEKEVLDTASDIESVAKINSTPRRRKSKVRLDYEKKILARETLPRAVKQFQRKHPVKHKTSTDDLKTKRITRNRANKAKLEELEEAPKQPKCKPHDFISVEDRTLPPPTNNVFAQKRLMDANTTSEDSNDSCESMLFIDLSEAGKTAEKPVKSVYEEETVDDLLEFVTTEQAVCISIPENEENSSSLHILKQMEDFMGTTVPQQKTVESEGVASASAENIYVPEDLTTRRESNEGKNVAKTTDHSIENILNKTPPNGELKTTSLNTNHVESEVFFSSIEQKIEKEMLPAEQETLLTPNEKIQEKEKTPAIADKLIPDQTPDLEETNKESLVTEISKDVALTAFETDKTIVQVEPENLSVKRNSVDQNEENCEKIFKTKAAMKAYEDRLQPNPCVVPKKSTKTELIPKKSGMRTRSRSKGSEDDTLKRTTDIDSVPPISSIDPQTDDSLELDKSNETSESTSTSLETSIATSIDDSLTEKTEVPSECLPEPENLTIASGLEDENLESTEITSINEEVSTPKTSQNEIEDLSVEPHLSGSIEKPQLEINQQSLNEENKLIVDNELTTETSLVEVNSSVMDDTVPLATDLSKMKISAQNLDIKIPSENELSSQEKPVNLSPVKTKSIAKEEKGRSLEKTIKKMKEKIVESEKYKKEQDFSKPSTEIVESEKAKKEPEISKISTDSNIYEAENVIPTQPDESQIPIDKNENQKKNEKVAPKEETKDKSSDSKKKESSHHKKGHSRSPSKSRTSSKRHDHSVDKEKSSRKDRSRSSSKSRSVDKHHKQSDGENDRTRRSKSKSVDEKDKKSRGSDQEELNGHRKRRSRSSSKSKVLEEKTRSSEKSSSKHKTSDTKDKQSTLQDAEDRHKKRSSKSPSKSLSNEVKAKHSRRSDSDKGKGRDKSEDKTKIVTSKSDARTKCKTEETSVSQSSKDKLIATDVENQKETDEKVLKVTSSKSHRSKTKQQHKSGESTTEHDLKNDEKVNKHRDSHKPKSKDSSKGQETSLKSVREKHNNEIGKSSRSHSREKVKSESASRTEKREKSSTIKDKVKENDKKTNRRSEEPKENGTSITKDKAKEKSYHHKGHKENTINLSTESNLNDPLGNKNSQEIGQVHLSPNKDNQKNMKVAIPKKRKYEIFEDSKESSLNSEKCDSSEPKIQKLSTETVAQPNESNTVLERTEKLHTETVIQPIESNIVLEAIEEPNMEAAVQLTEINASTETYSTKEDKSLQKSSEQTKDTTEVLSVSEVSKDGLAVSSTEDLSFEAFATGIKDAVASERTEENETTHNLDALISPVVPPLETRNLDLQKATAIQIEENKDSAPCFGVIPNEIRSHDLDGTEERNSEDTEISASVKIPEQIKNVQDIPPLQPVYVSPFSTAPAALDMHILSTTTAPSVKDFSVSLPLVPGVVTTESISSAIVVPDNLTSKVVSLPCEVSTSTTVQSTPSCSTAGMFTFNEEPETDNQENLNASDLFDASLGLGTTSIAEISTSMTLVQSLGPSTINFINDVSDNTEIDMQQSDKPNSFNSNFPRRTRVTEIRCFVEKESTADHNYTLGDPLLGGNNEDKNLLTTGLSLSDSPEEFPLNVSNLEELSFNENNFIGENGTLDDLGLLLPCKKEKPDFDNIIDDDTPKPEDVQSSIKHLNMLVGIPQPGHLKTISVDHSIDHSSNTDCSVSLGIDYAVNKLLNLGSGEASSQTNFFDIANMNIMESNVSSLHPSKETLEEPITGKSKDDSGGIASICNMIESNPSQHFKETQESAPKGKDESSSIASICNSYANALNSDSNTLNNQKVVVEPVEQCMITSMDQLKKNYISEPCERLVSKPVKSSVKTAGKPSTFATFVQSVKRDKNDSAKKKNEIDEMEQYTIRRNNRTPVFPPKKKTAIQQHVKSIPEKKSEVLAFDSNVLNNNKSRNISDTLRIPETSNECRIRVKTDLIKSSESKNRVNSDVLQLDYINENDQNIASEVVLPFSKPSPTNAQEKKTTETSATKHNMKHARFDKSGNDYIMENIINAHTDSKTRKNKVPIPEIKVPENSVMEKKRKSNFVDGDTSDSEKHTKRSDKRQRKSDDECDKSRTEPSKAHTKKSADTSHNSKPKALSTDEIFDQLLRQGSVNQLFVQKSNAASKNESNISPESKNRGYTTVPDTKKERMPQPQRAASHFHDSAKSRDNARHSLADSDNRRRAGYTTSNYGAPPDRRYADKKPFSDSSPKRVMRNSSHSYSSKSDPCFSREHPYKPRDRRSSTEHVNNSLLNSGRSEEGCSQDDDDYSWIAKFSGSGLFRDTPSDLFMPPGTKREDASS